MAKYTREQIIEICREEQVQFIRLQFTDIFGTLKKRGCYRKTAGESSQQRNNV